MNFIDEMKYNLQRFGSQEYITKRKYALPGIIYIERKEEKLSSKKK